MMIVFLSIVDLTMDLVTDGALGSFSPSVLKLAKVFRILRMGRLLKLIKVNINIVNCKESLIFRTKTSDLMVGWTLRVQWSLQKVRITKSSNHTSFYKIVKFALVFPE